MRKMRIPMFAFAVFAFAVFAVFLLMITATAMANDKRASPQVQAQFVNSKPVEITITSVEVGQVYIITITGTVVDNIFGAMNLASLTNTRSLRDAMTIDSSYYIHDAVYRTIHLAEAEYAVRRAFASAIATLINEINASNSANNLLKITAIDCGYGYAIVVVQRPGVNVAESRGHLSIMPKVTAFRSTMGAPISKNLVASLSAVVIANHSVRTENSHLRV